MAGKIGIFVLSGIGFFNWLVNFFAFHPEPGNVIDPHLIDPTIQEVFFESPDGVRLQAFFIPRSETDRVILILHGNAGNASMRLPEAKRLTQLGINVLLLSYRGYGKSGGSPSETGVYLDGRAALDYLENHFRFPQERIMILGRSLGSAVAIELAQYYHVAGLILVTPFSSGRDLADSLGLSWVAWVTGQPFNSMEKIPRVTAPALFIHGTDDHIVPQELGRKLFDRYCGPKEWKTVHGADHNDLVPLAGDQYWDWIRQFLDSHLPQQ